MDAHPIVAGLDHAAEGAQTLRHCFDPIGFLDAQRPKTRDAARSVTHGGKHHRHHCRVGRTCIVAVESAKFARRTTCSSSAHANSARRLFDACAAQCQIIEEERIRLKTASRQTFEYHFAAGDRRECRGIDRARRIGFDVDGAAADRLRSNANARKPRVRGTCFNRSIGDLCINPRCLQRAKRQLDVCRARRLLHELDLESFGKCRRDQHQGADELT